MSQSKRRFVDPHMHLWDLSINPWYRFPVPGDASGMDLQRPFPDRYDLDDYLETLTPVELLKCVHVTAVTAPKDVETESAWIGAIAAENGLPSAIIGTVDLDRPNEIVDILEREMSSPLFRGIRLLTGLDYESRLANEVLQALAVRGLIYDAVAHPGGGIAAVGEAMKRHEDLIVVLEHTGWPAAIDQDAFKVWRQEMAMLAALPNSFCKLSGLGMVVHATDADIFRRYFEACIALFGTARCMFASNMPVDLSYGSFEELLATFEQTVRGCSEQEIDDLFVRTAERVYQI